MQLKQFYDIATEVSSRKKVLLFLVIYLTDQDQSSGTHPAICLCMTVDQLLHSSDYIWTGRAAQIDAKTNFGFRNIVPKQWTLSGFLRHASANSMYKGDNKTSQQIKVLHMNKTLQRVTHFSSKFSRRNPTTALMAKSPWTHTLCRSLSIDQWYIFGIFEHNWGKRKHVDDLKQTHGAFKYKRKLNLQFRRAA